MSDGNSLGDWVEDAACRIPGQRLNNKMFEPLHREMTESEQRQARCYCVNCPVFKQCRQWVLYTTPDPLPYAFAAGMTSRQRQRTRHEMINNPDICTCRRCRYLRRKRDRR